MIPLGTQAPDFLLPDVVTGEMKSLQELKSDIATVIMFICNHCPYVIHVRQQLVEISQTYQAKGISFIAISANDADEYPADSPRNMAIEAQTHGYSFPYLYDESQKTAKAYAAECTPDFYVFDGDLACIYRGQLDDSRPGNNIPVTGADLRSALDNVLSGKPVSSQQSPSMGCNIKWKTA
jgi:thiol-disulfide isomerase/thioredoxin